MRVGVVREVKDGEFRVAATPAGAHELVRAGHEVLVEAGAGAGSGLPDADYERAGARVVDGPDAVWGDAEMVLKVKEPVAQEYARMQPGQLLFTYLHLAASAECTRALLDRQVTAVAYETVELPDGRLPLLAPMSEVAGRLAPQAGAHHLTRAGGGRGVLLGGVPGVPPATVVVLGAGVAGMSAAAIAVGMRARVLVLDRDVDKLRAADRQYAGALETVASNAHEVERACLEADLVIGAVLVAGARAPKLVSDELVARMKPGSVLVDIAVDQGGCFQSTHPTTHSDPVFGVAESVFYCVANMPGAVPRTSTLALTNVTLPYVLTLASAGWKDACRADPALARGLNTVGGRVVHAGVAEAHGLEAAPREEALR
ncbi:alanine dehydrogenase [Motilibacter aurantiacus]|uniref:alanine dehydrogenase n=1 Tax=Motilibacter aurantiacus TaxID=2714955 RepID=UPI001E6491D0|nr:alanine dehydrogenase [Motilibacter aurantiacus]NHC47068.1 alanine dehydrogenase [Motilibacter aurantiacus]